MDFKDGGSNSHVQFEILGSSFSETFGKDIKRVSSQLEGKVGFFCAVISSEEEDENIKEAPIFPWNYLSELLGSSNIT